jgi:preprotein translocase subunit YajC
LNFSMILAQAAAATQKAAVVATSQPAAAADRPWYAPFFDSPLLLIGAAVVFMMFFMGKGKRADEKARAEQLKQLKRGDRIQTIGGIQGTVVTVEESRIAVKVDESSNVKMWFVRNSIAKVIETGSDAKKAE